MQLAGGFSNFKQGTKFLLAAGGGGNPSRGSIPVPYPLRAAFGRSVRKNKLLIFTGTAHSISPVLKFEKLTTLWGSTGKISLWGFPSVPLTSLSACCLNTGTFKIDVPMRL